MSAVPVALSSTGGTRSDGISGCSSIRLDTRIEVS